MILARRRARWKTRVTLSRVRGPPWGLGKSRVWGRRARQYSGRTRRRWGESMTERSLRPLPCSMRITMRWLSMSVTRRWGTSETRRPSASRVMSRARGLMLGVARNRAATSWGLMISGSLRSVR
ncbi:MAG: hypothetical protein A2X53_18355 [Candidatus Rokubacteria bacterium GWA2_70_23]|nr:MAG: hypothetical protein A2X53_18355 [Candidatus Rokubacteria bacterium GWA2_70_23]